MKQDIYNFLLIPESFPDYAIRTRRISKKSTRLTALVQEGMTMTISLENDVCPTDVGQGTKLNTSRIYHDLRRPKSNLICSI